MARIAKITAREILDSRGLPTVWAQVTLEDATTAAAAVPSGASTGSYEALELRDGGKRFMGKGVLKALHNITRIEKEIVGLDPFDIRLIDQKMIALDNTPNKSCLGANAMLAVSMAVLRAGAKAAKQPLFDHIRTVYHLPFADYLLPVPMLNVINGGKHADSGLDIQEFMLVPTQADSFHQALQSACEIYHTLRLQLQKQGLVIAVGDEGGFAPKIARHEAVLQTLLQAAQEAGHPLSLAIDCAASEFYKDGSYLFEKNRYTAQQLTAVYKQWCQRYPLVSIEDPLQEDDWEGWQYITAQLGRTINLVGDDLFVTNLNRLKTGIENQVANTILIKVNQIGTVSETIDVIRLAQTSGYKVIVSHRSGETEDTFIADLAVAVNAGAIKTGAPARSERTAKYNRLLQIEADLKEKAHYENTVFYKGLY